MTHDKQSGAPDNKRIDLRDDREIASWCERFQCSEEDLRRAIADVGESALHVAEHLGLTQAALA